ncbi:MAG: PorV/PorQ family protein [Gemmatimonadaceae bacterium]
MLINQLRLAATAAALLWGTRAVAQGSTLPGTAIVPGEADRTTRVGTRGGNFLHIGVGARPQALAGVGVAMIDGPNALFLNPANVATTEGIGVFVSHMQMYGNSGISNTAGAVSVAFGQGAIGIGVQHFTSGDIDRTTENSPDGNDPVFPGTFAWTGTAASLHYARNVTDRLTAAIGARYAQEGIDFAHNSYFGADVSTRFRTGLYGLTVGASIMNIGGTNGFSGPAIGQAIREPRYNGQPTGRDIPIQFDTREAQMPTTFNFGVMSSLFGDAEALLGQNAVHSLTAEVDFKDAIDTDLQTAVGLEYSFKRFAFARVGKRFFNEQNAPWNFADGMAFGGGLRLPVLGRRLSLDYGYVIMGDLRNNQVLSFQIGS